MYGRRLISFIKEKDGFLNKINRIKKCVHRRSNITYFVNPLDILKSKISSKFDFDKKKIRIGWCAPFPPEKNGAASVTYWFVNELSKHNELEVYALPMGRIIERKLFPNVKYTQIKDQKLDYIIFFGLGTYFSRFAKDVQTKTIALQTAHLLDTKEQSKGEYDILKEINKADYVFAVTKYGKSFFKKNLDRNIGHLPHAVDVNKFVPLCTQKKDNFTVLFQSRLCFYKGIKQFLESIPFVLKKYPQVIFKVKGVLDTTDLIVWTDKNNPKIYNEIIFLLKKFKDQFHKNLIFDCSWSDYSKIAEPYQLADVLVFPSNNEGFGVPIIEAMSCGVPVIALNKAPMNEFIQNNKTGFLLNCRKNYEKQNYEMKFPHPEDIAKKIIWLIEHPKEAKKMGIAARESILKHYDLQKIVQNFVILLNKLKNRPFKNKVV